MKPKIYVVVTEKYVRGIGPMEGPELYYARDLDDLATQLGWAIDPAEWDGDPEDIPTPWKNLKNGHGDGADGYVIGELVGPDMERLSINPVLPEPE